MPPVIHLLRPGALQGVCMMRWMFYVSELFKGRFNFMVSYHLEQLSGFQDCCH